MAVARDAVKIIEIKNGRALIRVDRFSLCTSCHLTDWMTSSSVIETWINNDVNAKPGDLVQVRMTTGRFLASVFVLFGVPLIGLFAGIILADSFHYSNVVQKEMLFGIGGFFLSYFFVWLFDKFVARKKGFLPSAMKSVRINPKALTRELKGK